MQNVCAMLADLLLSVFIIGNEKANRYRKQGVQTNRKNEYLLRILNVKFKIRLAIHIHIHDRIANSNGLCI
jgi:hypothetical protein